MTSYCHGVMVGEGFHFLHKNLHKTQWLTGVALVKAAQLLPDQY